jgi:mono/diheme cytochrome c family protein
VIGGIVYRAAKLPGLAGHYLFADNYSGKIMAISSTELPAKEAKYLTRAPDVAQRGVSSLVATPTGDVYITTLGKSQEATGQVLKLVSAAEAVTQTDGSTPQQDALTRAELTELFNTHCGRCHGLRGKGDGPDAEKLGVALPNFTASQFQSSRTDEHLAKVIREGGTALGLNAAMPPWDNILSKEEVTAMVAYIRELGAPK